MISPSLTKMLRGGLSAPICLTWELTYGCNLSCRHCLSDSGAKAPGELSRIEALGLVDDIAAMGIFYVNIGGGEPTMRRDFFEIIGYAQSRRLGVKFSTNGSYIDAAAAKRLAAMDYVDVQVSIDGHDAPSNDAIRSPGAFAAATAALENLAKAGFSNPKVSVVATQSNVEHLDELLALAGYYGASLRLTRLRPSGRGAQSYRELNPSPEAQRQLYAWLVAHPEVLTGDSFFHLSPLGEPLEGLNMCGAGRVVCLIDPVGDVYACPFTIHPQFRAGNLREETFAAIWSNSRLFGELRNNPAPSGCAQCSAYQACQGGCMAAKFHTGASYDDPDPDCVMGHGNPGPERVSIRPRATSRATP